MSDITGGSRLGNLQETWLSRNEMPVGDWVQAVSTAYFNCNTNLDSAAQLLDTQPAEIQATLNLACMDESDLALVSEFNPPITTWFFVAECPSDRLRELLEEIQKSDHIESSAGRAQALLNTFLGPSILDSIATLNSADFAHLAKKATSYNALNDKHRKALASFGATLKRENPSLKIKPAMPMA